MSAADPFLVLCIALAATSFACRAGGFWLMRFIPMTPAFEAALSQAPLAIMIGIVAPAALHAGGPQIAGLATVALAMLVQRNDLAAALAGVAAVAIVRHLA